MGLELVRPYGFPSHPREWFSIIVYQLFGRVTVYPLPNKVNHGMQRTSPPCPGSAEIFHCLYQYPLEAALSGGNSLSMPQKTPICLTAMTNSANLTGFTT